MDDRAVFLRDYPVTIAEPLRHYKWTGPMAMSEKALRSSVASEQAGRAVGVRPELLVRRHASAVLALCLAHTRNIHDAEDAMQETFVKALSRLTSLRQPEKARPWLLQIARRTCIDRDRRRPPARTISEDLPAPESPAQARTEQLHAAIRQLSPDYRETITLYYLDGRSCASVAAWLGISEVAVRQRLLRGRLMLHQLLGGQQP